MGSPGFLRAPNAGAGYGKIGAGQGEGIGEGVVGRDKDSEGGDLAGDAPEGAGYNQIVSEVIGDGGSGNDERGVGGWQRSTIGLPLVVERARALGAGGNGDGGTAEDGLIRRVAGNNRRVVNNPLANGIIEAIGDIKVARAVHGNPVGQEELRARALVVGDAAAAGYSGDGAHGARGGDFAHGGIESVGDVEVGRGIHGDAVGKTELRGIAVAVAGARKARESGEGADHAGWGDFADGVVAGIGDINAAGVVHRAGRTAAGIARRY